jgi:hypothetical protein
MPPNASPATAATLKRNAMASSDTSRSPVAKKPRKAAPDFVFSQIMDRSGLRRALDNYTAFTKRFKENDLVMEEHIRTALWELVEDLVDHPALFPHEQTVCAVLSKVGYNTRNGGARLFAIGTHYANLQSMPRVIRHTIARLYYHDLDIKNAAPTLLLQYCNNEGDEGLNTPQLHSYVLNRDRNRADLMERMNMTKDEAKEHITATINGQWPGDNAPEWLKGIFHEGRRLAGHLKEHRSDLWEAAEAAAEAEGSENVEGKVVARLYFELEAACLRIMVRELRERGLLTVPGVEGEVAVLIHDGIMVPRLGGADKFDEGVMRAMEEAILGETGFHVVLEEKPMDEGLDVGEAAVVPLGDTALGAEAVLGRGTRRLSATHQDLQHYAIRRVKCINRLEDKVKSAEDDEERKEIYAAIKEERRGLHKIFDELFYIVGTNTLTPITNNLGVVVRYDSSVGAGWTFPLNKEFNAWCTSGDARTYRRQADAYGGFVSSDVFNTFCGFPVEQNNVIADLDYDPEVVRPMVDHLFLIGEKNPVLHKLLLDNFADLVQNPHLRPTYCIVVKGDQGCGKSSGFEFALRPIFGSDDPSANGWHGEKGYYLELRDAFQIMRDKFNTAGVGKLAIVLDDEQAGGDLKQKKGHFKNFTTTKFRMVEAKGQDPRMVAEYASLYILTNESRGVVDMEDIKQRRVVFMEMCDVKARDVEYFKNFIEHCSTREFAVHWFKFLMARDLTGYNRTSPILPQTGAMLEEYVVNRPAAASWIAERFMNKCTPAPVCHCLDINCHGSGEGWAKCHRQQQVCPNNKRMPLEWEVSWDTPSKIPREALKADYEVWRKAQGARYKGHEHDWDRQRESVLVTRKDDKRIFENNDANGRPLRGSYPIHIMQTVRVTKNTNGEERTRDEVRVSGGWGPPPSRENCYMVPPLNDLWDTFVKRGWLLPDQDKPAPPTGDEEED